jgi:hypothetical protein
MSWRRSDRCRPIGLTPTRSDLSPRIFAGVVAAALLAWAGHACFPAFASTCIHPDSARRLDVLGNGLAPRRARPRPPAPVRSNRRRRVLRADLAAPARLGFSAPAGDTRLSHRGVVDRPGRAPLLRFRSPSARAGRDAFVRRMPTVRTIPLRRFRHRPAHCRSPFRWRPPVRFCARGGASWSLPMWRTFPDPFRNRSSSTTGALVFTRS